MLAARRRTPARSSGRRTRSPRSPAYSGSAVWGSSPAIDPKRGQLYVATGNNYSAPASVMALRRRAGGDPVAQRGLSPAGRLLRLHHRARPEDGRGAGGRHAGAAVRRLERSTASRSSATVRIAPSPCGPGLRLRPGAAALHREVAGNGKPRDLVGAGQKSGQYWALDPDTGAIRVDDAGRPRRHGRRPPVGLGRRRQARLHRRTRTATASRGHRLPEGTRPRPTVARSGIDAATGQVLWQTARSAPVAVDLRPRRRPRTASSSACSLDPRTGRHVRARTAATGEILWSFVSGGGCLSGAAISNGEVFWGSGYSNFGFSTPNRPPSSTRSSCRSRRSTSDADARPGHARAEPRLRPPARVLHTETGIGAIGGSRWDDGESAQRTARRGRNSDVVSASCAAPRG